MNWLPESARASGNPAGANHHNIVAQDARLLIGVAEACRALGVGRSTLYALTRAGAIRSVRIGRRRMYPTNALCEWIRAGCPEAGKGATP